MYICLGLLLPLLGDNFYYYIIIIIIILRDYDFLYFKCFNALFSFFFFSSFFLSLLISTSLSYNHNLYCLSKNKISTSCCCCRLPFLLVFFCFVLLVRFFLLFRNALFMTWQLTSFLFFSFFKKKACEIINFQMGYLLLLCVCVFCFSIVTPVNFWNISCNTKKEMFS